MAEFGAFLTAEISTGVSNYLEEFAQGLEAAIEFGTEQARLYLRHGGLREAVYVIAAGAGRGFPVSYQTHLGVAMSRLPIIIDHVGSGIFEVGIDLDALGDESDLIRGAHQGAMLSEGMDVSDFKSFRISTKGQLQRATLPYGGEDLFNSPERRVEWWNKAIIERDFHTMVGKNWNWTKPATRTIEDAWEAEDVPTFERIAADRVDFAWGAKAPEWIWLEHGTAPTLGAGEPVIEPQGFSLKIQRLVNCVCSNAISDAVATFKRLLEERSVVGVKGPHASPYDTAGQFVQYKDLLVSSAPNLSKCLALI